MHWLKDASQGAGPAACFQNRPAIRLLALVLTIVKGDQASGHRRPVPCGLAACKLAISRQAGARKLWETKEAASGVCSLVAHCGSR